MTAAFAAAMLLGATAAMAAEPDASIAGLVGKEITIESASSNNLMPVGGKLTFTYDADANNVRVCTRQVASQKGQWHMDMAPGCNLVLTLTRAERFCTVEDVKAGNAEVLASCHRLRGKDVALQPATGKGAVELHDVIVFPVAGGPSGKQSVAILVDSPSRLTGGGIVIGGGG
ncbi:MAG: hypothetical protein ABI769_14560 [Pseudomonadota bacterium]